MRSYVKPELFYENFELSQHIATCGIDMNSGDTSICNGNLDGEYWGGMTDTVFSDGRTECSIDNGVIEGYCYTNSTSDSGKTFAS